MTVSASRLPRLALVLELLLGGFFVYAGALKAWDPAAFAADVSNYRILGPVLSGMMAVYLPWLELLAGGALLARRARTAALWIVLGLSLCFCAALGSALLRGLDISCGCLGGGSGGSLVPALLRASALMILSSWLLQGARFGASRPVRHGANPD